MSVRPGEQQADEPGAEPEAASAGAEVVRLSPGAAVSDAEASREPTLGRRLREAREAAGLSIAELAARTKIRQSYLTLIEADEHDRLPALTYALGFIKAYARTVGLDPEEAAARFRRESGRDDPPPSTIELKPLEERRIPSRGLVIATTAATLLAVALLVALGFRGAPPAVAPEAGSATAVAASPEPVAPPPAAEVAAPAAPVVLRAEEEVWIRITDSRSGERFFEGTLAKDQRLEIPADRAMVLRAGRAGALRVMIGDEQLPPLGGPADVLRAQPLDLPSLRAAAAPRQGLQDAPAPPAG
ncbi:helix-turn-helix domain-containing protein [Thermaurantiacus sp.]